MSNHEAKRYQGEDLMGQGVIEDFVKQGRTPYIHQYGTRIVTSTLYGQNYQEAIPDYNNPLYSCLLPPEGTQPGDTVTLSALSGFQFFSPEGELRGAAQWIDITAGQAQEIKARTKAALESLTLVA